MVTVPWKKHPEPEPQAVDEAGLVTVPGVLEAKDHATFDLPDGTQVYINGPDAGRLGDVVHESHPAAVAHPELFRPLRLSLGLRHDLLRAHPAAHARPEPALAQRNEQTVTEALNALWRSLGAAQER